MMNKIYLKVKAKSLAEEAKIIKKEEERIKAMPLHKRREYGLEDTLIGLTLHRKWDVRNEARATHLVRAYIAGKKCSSVENSASIINSYNPNAIWQYGSKIVNRITTMIQKYHEPISKEQVVDWLQT